MDLDSCVPVIVHGDDAEAHRRRSFQVTSFASLLTTGASSPWDSRMVLYVLDNSRSCTETQLTMDMWTAWSFQELAQGVWNDRDPWNRPMPERASKGGLPIASGWRAIIVCHRGDEKYLQKAYRTRVGWSSPQICWTCAASRERDNPCLYTHVGPHAAHRSTMISSSDFITNVSRPNGWIQVAGFHPSQLIYDVLHVFDLTLVPDAAASVPRLLL